MNPAFVCPKRGYKATFGELVTEVQQNRPRLEDWASVIDQNGDLSRGIEDAKLRGIEFTAFPIDCHCLERDR